MSWGDNLSAFRDSIKKHEKGGYLTAFFHAFWRTNALNPIKLSPSRFPNLNRQIRAA